MAPERVPLAALTPNHVYYYHPTLKVTAPNPYEESPPPNPRKTTVSKPKGPNVLEITGTCDEVRDKIKQFLDFTDMTVSEFCKLIDVKVGTYRAFMGAKDHPSGFTSLAYINAAKLIQEVSRSPKKSEEKENVTKSTKVSKKTQGKTTQNKGKIVKKTSSSQANGKVKPRAGTQKGLNGVDVSGLVLHDEEEGTVRVYDTCDTVRDHIESFLLSENITGAVFCRALSSQLYGASSKTIQSTQLSTFRSKSGPREGCSSFVFYAAYVFFEKLRISRDEPEDDDRLMMRSIWCIEGGFPRKVQQSFVVPAGMAGRGFRQDRYGRLFPR